ncbi:MAG: isochorismate synthase [Nostocoides sp.]|uniref:isochorismate synthase n=2 Tax=Nostocoides sp. TaxID=1917966 RepID=UPI002BFCB607|nr:isochorismate synthase [Tetrasphaera sp.]
MSTLPTADTQRLVARTQALPSGVADDLLALIPAAVPAAAVCSWVRRGEGIVGWGTAAEFTTAGADRFTQAATWWRAMCAAAVVRDDVQRPGTGPLAFGAMTYAAGSPQRSRLVVPSVVVGRRGDQAWLTTVAVGEALPHTETLAPTAEPGAPGEIAFADGPKTAAEWEMAVAEAVRRITRGVLDKVVLARALVARAHEPIQTQWLLRRLAERYDNTWVFAVDGLVGATPEMLVRLDRGLATSRVLAGTIRRTRDDEHDLALAASLARSSKDLEEHEYAVRSVADALGRHCGSMNVPESPFVLHLPNVMHLATDVAGAVDDRSTSLELAASLHPSAAVCGTPTAVADALITELEGLDRGRYAGPVGWMDALGDGEWGLALRSGQLDQADPRMMTLFAGCGIVAGSDPNDEVAESDAKFLPMRDALTALAPVTNAALD